MTRGASGFKTVGEEPRSRTTRRTRVPLVGGQGDREGAAGRTVVPSRGGDMSVSLSETHLYPAGVTLATRRQSQSTTMNTKRPQEKDRNAVQKLHLVCSFLDYRKSSRIYNGVHIGRVLR